MSFSHSIYLKIGSQDGTDIISLIKDGYELEDCHFALEQGIDKKGKASTDVRGGTISLRLSSLPTQEIVDWGMKSRQYHKGVLVTLDEQDIPIEKIMFENAACIFFDLDFTSNGKNYTSTRLIIHAEKLIFDNGIDFDNFWTKY